MEERSGPVGAIEVGGSHVTAACIDLDARASRPGASRQRRPLAPDGSRDDLLGAIVEAARAAGVGRAARCGVAVPGPFDHDTGVARYTDVGKFEALAGVDVGAALRTGVPGPAFMFVNDAAAFLVGEWVGGAAAGHDRAVGVTLGTGVGSAFLAGGRIVTQGPGVPPGGEVHFLELDGGPLEDTVSARAIVAEYRRRVGAGVEAADVRAVAARARAGDAIAADALASPLRRLGLVLAPYLARFGATVLVVGGSIAGSWDLVHPALAAGLAAGDRSGARFRVEPSVDSEWSALLGAAWLAAAAPG